MKDRHSIHATWAKLACEILVPAELTDEQLDAIASVHAARCPTPEYYRALPMTVARFSDAAKAMVEKEMHGRYFAGRSEKLEELFRWDTDQINEALFGDAPLFRTSSNVGRFDQPQAPILHYDGMDQLQVAYAARLGSLPAEYISGARQAAATPYQKQLIHVACKGSNAALMELSRMKMLEQVPLGDVVLIATGMNGTLHASSLLPARDQYSCFLRSMYNLAPVLR